MSRRISEKLTALTTEIRSFIARVILFNEKVGEAIGLNGTDLQCLHLLSLQGSATPGELAKWASLTTGGMTVVIDRLEKAGYVVRERNPLDRRSLIVRPVMPKLRKLEAIYRQKGEALNRVLSNFDDQELTLLFEFFRRINLSDQPED